MLAVDEHTIALPQLRHARPDDGDRPPALVPEHPKPLRPGTAIYHCYRYERHVDPVPTYADGSVPSALPADPRGWRLTPWRQYERIAEFDAPAATGWVKRQLLPTVGNRAGTDLARDRWVDAIAAECALALDTLAGAYQTWVDLSGGNLLALAVVGIWDSVELHPKLALGGWY
jgi:hypothetical protein